MSEFANVMIGRLATRQDLDAALAAFESACIRGEPKMIRWRTEEAQRVLQAHLDAVSSSIAMALRDGGLR